MISTTIETVGYTRETPIEQNTIISASPVSAWFPDEDEEEPRLDSIISDDAVRIVENVIVIALCGLISACGLVANVINVLVFFRQGALSSSCNVSLLALAFADMGCLVPVLGNSVSYALHRLGQFGIFQTPKDLFDTAVVWPHIMCMQIVCWVTAYIAFERCICVLFPLKVKSLFSAKMSVCVNGVIATIVIVSFIPIFTTQRIAKQVDPTTNDTRLVVVMTDFHIQVIHYSDIVQSMTLRPLALLIVFTCTQITIFRVKLSTTWRKSIISMSTSSSISQTTQVSTGAAPTRATTTSPPSSTTTTTNVHQDQNSDQSNNAQEDRVYTIETPSTDGRGKISVTGDSKKKKTPKESSSATRLSKETRLIKMTTLICAIFMVCNAPDILGVYVLVFQMPILGVSFADNVFFVLVSCLLCLESINSSINILVYYRLSSVYRQTLRTMLGWG